MKELKLLEQIAINNTNCSTYQAISFDGEFYYFCVVGRKIVDVYDICFHKVKTCHVTREYGCITYNSKEGCFFAMPKYHANGIVKLDKNMKEIGYIDISGLFCEDLYITSISYSCIEDSIILATRNKIYKISIKCDAIDELLVCEEESIVNVVSISPGYVVVTEKEESYNILIYNCSFILIHELCIKKCDTLCDVLFNPCTLYYHKKCEEGVTLYLLMNTENNYSKLYKISVGYECFGYELCECNFKICKKNPKPCECIGTDCLIETIALIQASIAHILNAEGEKIQKVLAVSDDIPEILCVNKEVERMIVKITHLEQVLYDTLVELKNCNCCVANCNGCCDEENKCICDIDGGKA